MISVTTCFNPNWRDVNRHTAGLTPGHTRSCTFECRYCGTKSHEITRCTGCGAQDPKRITL